MMSNYNLPVNIGNPTEMTMLQFAGQIIRATRSRSKIVSNRCRRMTRNNAVPTSPAREKFSAGRRKSRWPAG